MYNIKKNLTRDSLQDMLGTDILVFEPFEELFLKQYAPMSMDPGKLEDALNDPAVCKEINQMAFEITAKIDITAATSKYPLLAIREKRDILNPLLTKFSIDEIHLDGELYESFHEIKSKGLELIARTSQAIPQQRFTKIKKDVFVRERNELTSMFGDVPIMVYGSSLYKKDAKDVDTMIFPPAISKEIYKKIFGKFDETRQPALQCVITPATHLDYWTQSDAMNNFDEKNSVLINGELDIPMISREDAVELKRIYAATTYFKLRKALTDKGLETIRGITPKINSILQIPKYVQKKLFYDSLMKEPEIRQFAELPDENELVASIIEANMECNKILKIYHDYKH
jgi:hypothetical protein